MKSTFSMRACSRPTVFTCEKNPIFLYSVSASLSLGGGGRNRTSFYDSSQPSQLPAIQASALVPQCFQPSHKGSLTSRTILERYVTILNLPPSYCQTIILLELLLEVEFDENSMISIEVPIIIWLCFTKEITRHLKRAALNSAPATFP